MPAFAGMSGRAACSQYAAILRSPRFAQAPQDEERVYAVRNIFACTSSIAVAKP
jgi:hypothetical protein